MRNSVRLFTAITLFLLPAVSLAGGERFDGKWLTTVSCDPSRGALGFSYRFVGEIKDGNYRGLHGTEGEPGFLLIEGKIADDGTARLYAEGRTGSKEYVPGRDTPSGTEFGYHIKAQFNDRSGTGTRVEGRPCTFEFDKQ
ncbi:MAG TPA: hypothetical protein VGE85_04475 [Terracidiphilus sp.]|jgi:hypothetical protein